jgi:hypothetical protein
MPRFAAVRKALVDALSGPRVVFHHVAKTAGSSVAQALRIRYAVSFAGFPSLPTYSAIQALHPADDEISITQKVDSFQEYALLYHMYNDTRCISGHVRFSNVAFEKFSSNYKFITTLRDPVELMISLFFFETRLAEPIWQVPSDIERYLEIPRVQLHGASYSYFYSGLPSDSDPRTPAAIERSKANLGLFSAVGFVDDMEGFQRQLRERIGLRLRIGHANKSKASSSERASIITPDIRRKIEAISAPNIEIYEFAKQKLAR